MEEQNGQGERQVDERGTTGIVARRAASVTAAQSHSTASAGVSVARRPMHTAGSQQAIFGAWRIESLTEAGSTTDDIVSNAFNYPSSKKRGAALQCWNQAVQGIGAKQRPSSQHKNGEERNG